MPVYQYQGQFYELSETDPAVAKKKIIASLGQAAPEAEGGFFPAVRAGATELGGGISALMGRVGLKDPALAQQEYEAAKAKSAQIFQPTEDGWTESPWTKFKETLGGSLPYMAAPLAAGAAAATLPVTGPAAAVATLGAAGLASAGQFTATNLTRQLEEEKKRTGAYDLAGTDLQSAALAAIPQAALDTLALRFMPGVGKLLGDAGIQITKESAKQVSEQILKKTLTDYAATTGKAVGREGLTESAQQVFERLQAGLSITDPEARKEYIDSFIGGAVLGGALAPAGRYVERGTAAKQVAAVEQAETAQQRLAARAAEEAKRKDPAYAIKLGEDYEAAVEQMKALQAAVPKRPGKDALPEEQMAFEEAKVARDAHLKDVLRPLTAEYAPRKAEISQLRERRRVEGLTQEDYMLEQMGVKPEAIAGLSQEDYLLQQLNAPPPAAAAPEAAPSLDTYAQERMALANERLYGVAELTDYVEYLLQQPEMAAQLVATNAKLPGLGKKDNAAVLGGLKLKIAEQSKEQAVALAESRPDLAPLVAEKPDPIALWKASLEQSDEQTKEELLGLDFESALGAGASPVVATPEQIKPIQNPQVLLRQIDNLVTARDAADKATNDAFGAGNKELGVKKAQEREAAQTAINSVEQSEGPARAIVSLRKAQDTALMNVAQLADDLRAGRTLGGPEAGTASSTPETLTNQINEQRALFIRTAIQEAALTRRLFGRSLTQDEALKAGLEIKDVFDEWVTRSMAQPRSAVLEEQIVQPAQMRGTQLVRGAETAMVDPRPPEERRFGAYRAATQVLQEQLRKISSQLVSVPKGALTREEAVIRRQSAESEAAKVAEASGETAQTLAGQLRRRRDYVGGLIDQAFQTRRVPGIAETLLTRAQDFMPNSTNAFLDAAENIASRIVRGQNVERGDLVTMRDELRAASARPGEAEVVGEREGQRELFPAEERRALAPKMVGTDLQGKPVPKTGALGLIREKPEAFEAVRAKEAAKAKRANAAIQKSEKLTQDIKDALAQFDKDRQAELAKQVEESESSLQSAWQSAVKKAKEMVVAARRVAQKPKIDALKAELSAIRKGGVTGLNKETVDRFIAAQAALESIDAEINDAVNAAEFLPFTAANKWVAFAKGRVEQAKEALAAAKTPQNVQALNQQELALRQAEQARLQSLKGEEKIAEAARMRAAQGQVRDVKGQELPGVRRVAGRVEKIKPAERAEERATTEAERAERAEGERAARAAEREEEQADLEQSILDLGTQVAELAAAKKRARTPENKAKLQEQIAALTKAAQIAQAQLDALGEVKPRRKGPATVLSGAGLAKGRPLRTGTGEPRSTFLGQANVLAEQLRAQTPAQKAAVQKEEAAVDKAAQEKKSPKALKATAYEEYDRFSRGVEVESPDLNAEQVKALEDNDVGQALSLLASDKRADPVHRAVAQRLAMLLDATDVELNASLKDDQGREVFGMALASGKKIRLSRAGGLTHELLLHEGTHAAAERVLMAPESALTPLQLAAKRELQALFAAVQRDPSITSTEAKASLSEFVAEVMSNRNLQQQLAKKPWRAADALKAFKSVILRLLGIRETQSMLGASMKAIDAIFLPTSAQPTKTDSTRTRYSQKDIAALHDGSNSMRQFAENFPQYIKQKDRTTEDVDRIGGEYLRDMLNNPEDYVAPAEANRLDYESDTIMSDGKVFDPENPLHLAEATPTTFVALEAQEKASLRENEADTITAKRNEALRELLSAIGVRAPVARKPQKRGVNAKPAAQEIENNSYTMPEKALVAKAASKYGVQSTPQGRLKLVTIDPSNRHPVAVVSKEAADAIIEELRAGKNLKTAFLDGMQRIADKNAERNKAKNGWQKFEMPSVDSSTSLSGLYTEEEVQEALDRGNNYDAFGDVEDEGEVTVEELIELELLPDRRQNQEAIEKAAIELNAGAAGTSWCTGASVDTARDQIKNGDFYIYYANGKPEVAIRMGGTDVIAEIRGNTRDQWLTAEQQKIANDFLRSKRFNGADRFIEQTERKASLIRLFKGEPTTEDYLPLIEALEDDKGTASFSQWMFEDLFNFRKLDGYASSLRPKPTQKIKKELLTIALDGLDKSIKEGYFFGDVRFSYTGEGTFLRAGIKVENIKASDLVYATGITVPPSMNMRNLKSAPLNFTNLKKAKEISLFANSGFPALERVENLYVFEPDITVKLSDTAVVGFVGGYKTEGAFHLEGGYHVTVEPVSESGGKFYVLNATIDAPYVTVKNYKKELSGDAATEDAPKVTVKTPNKIADAPPVEMSGPAAEDRLLFARPQYAPGAANAGRVADMIIGKQPTMLDSVMKNMGLAFRTQVIDALAPLEKIANTSMDALKGTQMMYYLRMYGMRNNMTAEAISNGVVQLKQLDRKDGDKEWVIESEKGVNIKDMVQRLAQKDVVKAAGSPDAANRLFTLYLAALRGERVGYNKLSFGRAAAESELKEIERELASPRTTPEDKPRLLQRKAYLEKNINSMPTAADFKAAKDEIEANAPLKAAFDEVRGMYNEYNANLLNFLVDTGAMSKTEAQRLLKNGDYIPYYRMRGGNAELVIGGETPIRVGNLKDSPHLQELVGGEEPIFNFLDSSVQNTSMLLDMALRNIAAKNVAYELADVGLASKPVKASKTGAPKGSLEFKKDGVDYFVVVNTDHIGVPSDLLVKGMAGIPTMLPVGIRLLGIPARVLRRAVTSTPIFAAKQLFRDSTAAFMISGANSAPLLGALRKLGKTSPLESRGITGGQTFTGMPEDVSRLLRDMQEGRPGWSKAFAKMEAMSIEADAATRRAQYESYLAQGLSEMEATLMALESMNFSKRGLSPTMHMASTIVPFLNSQIQGLDVLYKAMTGKMPFNEKLDIQRKLFTRGAMMFMGTMAYAAAMQDDEEYKNAPPDVKYGNWFVRVPFLDQYAGEPVTVRVPIPFEIGYIFKALPEMLYNSMQSEAGAKDALKALNHILIQMVPGGSSMVPVQIGDVKLPAPVVIPAAMKPVIEVGLGKSFFTGRDIESAREQQEVPGMRYRPGTSEIAKYIGEATNFSPIKIETLVSGYTGGLGLAMLHALSVPLPKAATEVPEKRWTELPLVGSSFQAADASGIVNDVYERLQKVTQASATYKGLVDRGEMGKAQAFLQKNLPLMSLDGIAGDYRKDMGDLSKDERMIRGAPSLTAEEKTKLLAQIRQTKIMIATQVRTLLTQTSEASERKELQASPP